MPERREEVRTRETHRLRIGEVGGRRNPTPWQEVVEGLPQAGPSSS